MSAIEEAQRQLQKKYGVSAQQAGAMIEKGLAKLLSMLPPATLPGVGGVADLERLDEAGLVRLRENAAAAIAKLKTRALPGADGREPAKSKNKFL